jgi:ribonucrease Y
MSFIEKLLRIFGLGVSEDAAVDVSEGPTEVVSREEEVSAGEKGISDEVSESPSGSEKSSEKGSGEVRESGDTRVPESAPKKIEGVAGGVFPKTPVIKPPVPEVKKPLQPQHKPQPHVQKAPQKKPQKPAQASPVQPQPNVTTQANAVILEAKSKARELVVEAKDQALKIKETAQNESRKTREDANALENKINVRKAQLDATEKELVEKVRGLKSAKAALDTDREEVGQKKAKVTQELSRVAGMTKDEAKEELLKSFGNELREEKGKRIKEMEEEIQEESEAKSKEILIDAMRFGATDYVVEYSTSKVKLEDAELKGRIIGKEGRNIRKFEELTGVDLDLDATEGYITISCFDPVRREIAKIALERLIADGRIQPARIEEIVGKSKEEIEKIMHKEGDALCHKVGAYGVPKKLISVLGKFRYRFSYGQNMIEHTLEVTRIGMAIARKLGADVDTVRLGCLYHDVGKVSESDAGSHVELGTEFLKEFNIPEKILACVGEHHNDTQSSIESAIVALADHISGARPGSRGEDYESYVKRLKALEDSATSFDGVDKAYAVSAGREVRVFVDPKKVDDFSTEMLARDIAKKIELEQSYPGVVKVIVIRETRVSETAK